MIKDPFLQRFVDRANRGPFFKENHADNLVIFRSKFGQTSENCFNLLNEKPKLIIDF